MPNWRDSLTRCGRLAPLSAHEAPPIGDTAVTASESNPQLTQPGAVHLDRLGALRLPDRVVQAMKTRINQELRRDWPDAAELQLSDATERILALCLRTMETGLLDYDEVRRVGEIAARNLEP
jgi:hypothetical protein